MEANDHKLTELSQHAGVNLLELKQKYTNEKKNTTVPIANTSTSTSTGAGTPIGIQKSDLNDKQIAYNKLDKYKICMKCNGQGIINELYNHMVINKTCDACDGECIYEVEILKKVQDSIDSNV